MRDIKKDKDYFIQCIQYEKERIEKFSAALGGLDANNVEGITRAQMYLANFYRNLFVLSYSAGEAAKDIYPYYLEWVKKYSIIADENDSLYDIIEIFSIGVLYDVNKEQFIDYLRCIIKRTKTQGGMAILCMDYLEKYDSENLELEFEYLDNVAKSENKIEELIKAVNVWYGFHKGAYWYDTHKSSNDVYCGYWCFDLGAMAKIFNITDEGLKNDEFYPYDLVHQDN